MFDAAPLLDQPDEPQLPDSIEIADHLHRLNTDFSYRHEVRQELINSVKRLFSVAGNGAD